MQGVLASNWVTQSNETVLIAAMPKLGKTLFATSAPLPMVVIACDLGKLSIAPNQDRSKILVLPYQELTREMGDLGTSVPKKDIYTKLMRDLSYISKAIRNREDFELEDGTKFSTPSTVIFDGFSRLNSMLVDGKLALNNRMYVEDLDKQSRYNFWGKRLTDVYTTVQQFASLSINVAITSWVKPQMDKEGNPTGALIPDIGGAMDLKTAGVVGSALYAVSRGGRYYIRTKPDGFTPWVGVRDKYNLSQEIDVTIDEKNQTPPWERIFGGGK